MTQWDERVEGSPTKSLISEIVGRLESLEVPEDAADLELLDRVRSVAELVSWLIENTDAGLVTSTMLSAPQQALSYLRDNLNAYADGGDPSHLSQCDAYSEQVLDGLAGWPSPTGPIDPESYRKGLESFRKSAGQFLRKIEDEIKALSKQGESASSDLKNRLEEIGQQIDALTTQVETERQGVQTLSTQYQQQFLDAQETRQSEFNTALEKQQEAFEERLAEAIEQGESSVSALQQSGNKILENMQTANEKAERLLEAIGKTGTTFKYREWGNEQKTQANFWRWVTAGSLLAIVAIGIWFLWGATETDLDATTSVGKLFISIPLGVLAAYAARQSHQHREREHAARELELDMAALDPFIALLDETEQKEIKSEMARRLFGHRYRPSVPDGGALPPNLIDEVSRAVKQVLGRSTNADE